MLCARLLAYNAEPGTAGGGKDREVSSRSKPRRLFSAQTLPGPGTIVRFDARESHHGRDVLRLREGDAVLVFDRAGNQYAAVVEEAAGKHLVVGLRETVPPAPETSVPVSLYLALAKGAAFESAIQKAVELGAWEIVPFLSERCAAKVETGAGLTRKIERWRQIVLSATKQCGRARVAEVVAPLAFEQAVRRPMRSEVCICCATDADAARLGEALRALQFSTIGSIGVMIGPEGGLSPSEVESARRAGWRIATLGPRTLRVETAVTAALALVLSFLDEV